VNPPEIRCGALYQKNIYILTASKRITEIY